MHRIKLIKTKRRGLWRRTIPSRTMKFLPVKKYYLDGELQHHWSCECWICDYRNVRGMTLATKTYRDSTVGVFERGIGWGFNTDQFFK